MSGGISVGGIAAPAVTAMIGAGAPTAIAISNANQPATAVAINATIAPPAGDFVVNISNAGLQALRADLTSAVGAAPLTQLTDDLAALALLAILERDQQQQASLANAALAIGAYLAMQSLG